MITHCPNCQSRYSLNSTQLREQRGITYCDKCNHSFDALQLLLDEFETKKSITSDNPEMIVSQEKVLPWEKPMIKLNLYWIIGLFINVALLIGQFAYFEAGKLSQNPRFRPQLEQLANKLHRNLPLYQNIEELSILNSSFEKQSDNSRLLKIAIMNQADFSQAYPKVKLILFNDAGIIFSQRLFNPSDYLPKVLADTTLLADSSAEIELHIASLQTLIGGYTLDLVY